MINSTLKILFDHKRQFISDLSSVKLTDRFRGRPVLSQTADNENIAQAVKICPTGALMGSPLRLDMGRCLFCGECARIGNNDVVKFTNDWHIWSYTREGLIVNAGDTGLENLHATTCGKPVTMFRNSLKLRQISAGGDTATEMELNASGNVNFDVRRLGIEFTASPRHADGVVVSGPMTRGMSRALEVTLGAIAEPRVVILAGADAISGGLFAGSEALDRSFLERHHVSLYLPGNPPHPMVFIGGVAGLIGKPL